MKDAYLTKTKQPVANAIRRPMLAHRSFNELEQNARVQCWHTEELTILQNKLFYTNLIFKISQDIDPIGHDFHSPDAD
jgi:hypothetical protein